MFTCTHVDHIGINTNDMEATLLLVAEDIVALLENRTLDIADAEDGPQLTIF